MRLGAYIASVASTMAPNPALVTAAQNSAAAATTSATNASGYLGTAEQQYMNVVNAGLGGAALITSAQAVAAPLSRILITVQGYQSTVNAALSSLSTIFSNGFASVTPWHPIAYTEFNSSARTTTPGLDGGSAPATTGLAFLLRPRITGTVMSLWDGGTRSGAPDFRVVCPVPGETFGTGHIIALTPNVWQWVFIDITDESTSTGYGNPGYFGPATRFLITITVGNGSRWQGTNWVQSQSTMPAVNGLPSDILSTAAAPFVGDVAAIKWFGATRVSEYAGHLLIPGNRAENWLYHPKWAPNMPGGFPRTH